MSIDPSAAALPDASKSEALLCAFVHLCTHPYAAHGWGVYSSDTDRLLFKAKECEDAEIWQSEHRLELVTYIAEVDEDD